MSNFKPFAQAIAAQFQLMCAGPLVRMDVDRDLLWSTYLDAFPEGTNEIFRTRREFDGSYDRAFVKKLGAVAMVSADGNLMTIWQAPAVGYPFDAVCQIMHNLVSSAPILGAFRIKEPKTGYVETTERLEDNSIRTWNHFHADIPKPYYSTNVDEEVGNINTTIQVTKRGLEELTPEAVAQVLELIDANAIYRGTEFRGAVAAFQKLQNRYLKSNIPQLLLWSDQEGSVGRIRNTAIGTLLQDLSEDKPLELAVKSFEAKVAPSNYKRTSALITPGMVKEAMATINAEGLEPSLQRRFANLGDLSINSVLWADSAARNIMEKGSIGDILAKVATPKAKTDKAIDIGIDEFIEKILPRTESMDIVVKNNQRNNLMSLTTAVDPTAPYLFKWANPVAWSYNGNIADSEMRAAVQARGGSVSGVFRFTHQWNYGKRNASLMDLHVFMPKHGTHNDGVHDNYGNNERVGWNHRNHPTSGGVQDVDYVHPAPKAYIPVENITFPTIAKMPDGKYVCKIHNWQARSPNEGGFKAEIEFGGTIYEYEVDRPLKNKEWIAVAEVTKKGDTFTIEHKLPTGSAPQRVWGVTTEQFVKVNTLLLSPNHWDTSIGNKHWFFIIDDCKNDEPARGIYNEFLRPDLDKHRKVFEILGDKTKCQPTDDQLSGLGFSSTKKDSVTVRVTGPKINAIYTINF